MSLKIELNKKVNETRNKIINSAINVFVGTLKSEMFRVAEEGRTKGSISI